MSTSQKIKKWFKNIVDQDRLDFAYYPWRDWRVIVIIFLLGEVIIFSSHYFFYQWSALDKNQIDNSDGASALVEVKNKLDQMASRYQNKQRELDQAKQNR